MKLKKWLRKRNVTPEEFAIKMEVNPQTVRGWLDGKPVTRRNAMGIEWLTNGKVLADSLPKVKRRFLGRRYLGRKMKPKGRSNEPNGKLRAV